MEVIFLQVQFFLIHYYELISGELSVKLVSDECHETPLILSQNQFR